MDTKGIPITDPVELAWCEFARKREEKWRPIEIREQSVSIASFKAGAEWERAACAELAREAGCLCWAIRDWDESTELVIQDVFDNAGIVVGEEVTKHDRRCPAAILAAIEDRGMG